MSDIQHTELTAREMQRREIAAQVEKFLEHGGRIDVLNGPLGEASSPIGRVWWEVPESLSRL